MQLFERTISWIPWMVALLTGLVLLISAIQPHTIAQSLQALTSPIQRRYVLGGNNPVLIMLRMLFQLTTVSFACLLAIVAFEGDTQPITGGMYLLSMGILLAVMLVKGLLDRWIQLTFRYALNAKTYYKYRSELWMLVSLSLLLMLIFTPWLSTSAKWIIPLVVLGLYFMVLWWKQMQVFGWSIEHIGYTLLYMIHVEVLPLVIALIGIHRVI